MNYWQIEGHEGNRQENVVLHGRVKLTKCDNNESNQTYNEKTGPMKQIGRVECRWNVFLYLHFIIIDWRFWISKEMISFFFTSPPPSPQSPALPPFLVGWLAGDDNRWMATRTNNPKRPWHRDWSHDLRQEEVEELLLSCWSLKREK